MKTAIYVRISTQKQETRNQTAQLREFAAKQDWQIVREYTDTESGSRGDRAAFQQMFADASRRKFDCLLFWSLDRFSREGVLPTLRHLERLTAYGISWRSYTEQFFDSCGPFRDAVIGIMATLAKQERIRISERTKAGLAMARARERFLAVQGRFERHPAMFDGCDHPAIRSERPPASSASRCAPCSGCPYRKPQIESAAKLFPG